MRSEGDAELKRFFAKLEVSDDSHHHCKRYYNMETGEQAWTLRQALEMGDIDAVALDDGAIEALAEGIVHVAAPSNADPARTTPESMSPNSSHVVPGKDKEVKLGSAQNVVQGSPLQNTNMELKPITPPAVMNNTKAKVEPKQVIPQPKLKTTPKIHKNHNSRMVGVTVYVGDHIDQVVFHYSDGSTQKAGYVGGQICEPFIIPQDDFITTVRGTAGIHLKKIQFETNGGRKSPEYIGDTTEHARPFTFSASRDNQIWDIKRETSFCSRISGIEQRLAPTPNVNAEKRLVAVLIGYFEYIDQINFYYSDGRIDSFGEYPKDYVNYTVLMLKDNEVLTEIETSGKIKLEAIDFSTNLRKKIQKVRATMHKSGKVASTFKAEEGSQIWSLVRYSGFCGLIKEIVERPLPKAVAAMSGNSPVRPKSQPSTVQGYQDGNSSASTKKDTPLTSAAVPREEVQEHPTPAAKDGNSFASVDNDCSKSPAVPTPAVQKALSAEFGNSPAHANNYSPSTPQAGHQASSAVFYNSPADANDYSSPKPDAGRQASSAVFYNSPAGANDHFSPKPDAGRQALSAVFDNSPADANNYSPPKSDASHQASSAPGNNVEPAKVSQTPKVEDLCDRIHTLEEEVHAASQRAKISQQREELLELRLQEETEVAQAAVRDRLRLEEMLKGTQKAHAQQIRAFKAAEVNSSLQKLEGVLARCGGSEREAQLRTEVGGLKEELRRMHFALRNNEESAAATWAQFGTCPVHKQSETSVASSLVEFLIEGSEHKVDSETMPQLRAMVKALREEAHEHNDMSERDLALRRNLEARLAENTATKSELSQECEQIGGSLSEKDNDVLNFELKFVNLESELSEQVQRIEKNAYSLAEEASLVLQQQGPPQLLAAAAQPRASPRQPRQGDLNKAAAAVRMEAEQQRCSLEAYDRLAAAEARLDESVQCFNELCDGQARPLLKGTRNGAKI